MSIVLQVPFRKQPPISTRRYEMQEARYHAFVTLNIALQRIDPALYRLYLIQCLTGDAFRTNLDEWSIVELADALFTQIDSTDDCVAMTEIQRRMCDSMKHFQGVILL
jgi:hypothetical protein